MVKNYKNYELTICKAENSQVIVRNPLLIGLITVVGIITIMFLDPSIIPKIHQIITKLR